MWLAYAMGRAIRSQSMPGPCSAPVHWAWLPSELWERVFALERADVPIYEDKYVFMDEKEKRQQSGLHQLRTVCKSFAAIFDQNSSYYCDLALFEHVGCSHMPSLLNYLEQHGSKVKNFATSSPSPWSEAALSALQPHHSELVTAHFVDIACDTMLLLLPAFPFSL